MIVKRGSVVCHTGVNAWGTGKVIEVAAFRATILFSDGITRKIASSHYDILEPADPSSFVASASIEPVSKVKAKAVPRKKKLAPAAVAPL